MPLYEYAVVAEMDCEDCGEYDDDLIVPPTAVVAKDEATARAMAVRDIPEYIRLDEVEIFVRPFE